MIKEITSPHNTYIKDLVLLKEKSKARKKTGRFLIEGLRELNLALQGNYIIDTVLFDTNLISSESVETLINKQGLKDTPELIEISTAVYHKLAHRDTTEGILAVAQAKSHSLLDINFKAEKPLILVTESIEKPGNIGALLRTADAANVEAVLIANPKTDVYNPNCIRSSVGCVFTNQIAVDSTENIIKYLQSNNINVYCATLSDSSQNYHSQDYNKATAIVVGTEATGLTQEFINAATQNIMIPMQGKIDSMNVSVSAAILIFEAKRQRYFK
ncbi:MAG: RNA methyltransferase [Flavobacteriaceae bacterium]|nr:RNA methyltransferase [Flavobacteriaceae bacterium]